MQLWRQASRAIAISALTVVISNICTGAPTTRPIIHVYHAYAGQSGKDGVGADLGFQGYAGRSTDVTRAVAGILSIDPGHKDLNGNGVLEPTNEMWRNYVLAAQMDVPYAIKNVVLVKQKPGQVQCSEVFSTSSVTQHGTANTRLWWPLLYEAPGTTWTLTILYGTMKAWDDDGSGPNQAGYVHSEIWQWSLDTDLIGLKMVLETFHELPFGVSSTPLLGDDDLYRLLSDYVDEMQALVSVGDTWSAALVMNEFELTIADRCISDMPMLPAPTGLGMGVAQTTENPACCKLLIDAEYIGRKYGMFTASK